MHYRTEIDGLRALAVIAVILFHAGFRGFDGGFVGVDVFFVISGYLITSIILLKLQQGRFSLLGFYERRARRILPALMFVMLACIPFAWVYMDAYELKEFGQSLVSTALFVSNIFFYLKSGYFDTANELKPLLHTWSLAVEEQYYIFFPLFLMVLYKRGRKWIQPALLITLLGSLILAEWGSQHKPDAAFYWLPTRIWELMVGAVIAVHLAGRGGYRSQTLSALGLGMILLSIFMLDEQTPFPGLHALLPVVGAGFIILFAAKNTLVHSLLSHRIPVGVGLISYSLYLWHQPVLVFMRIYFLEELNVWQSIAAIVISLLLAVFSKQYVEDYFRFRFIAGKRYAYMALSSLLLALFVGLGYSAHYSLGFPQRNSLALQLAQNHGLSEQCNGADFSNPACMSTDKPNTILWGDSYAMHLARALDEIPGISLQQATLSACPPIIGYSEGRLTNGESCEAFNQRFSDAFLRSKIPYISTIMLSSTFKFLDTETDAPQLLENTLIRMKKLGYRVVLISPTPASASILKCIKQSARSGTSFDACQYDIDNISKKYMRRFSILDAITARVGIQYVDLRKILCQNKKCRVSIKNQVLYRDGGHLSNGSVDFMGNSLKPFLSIAPPMN